MLVADVVREEKRRGEKRELKMCLNSGFDSFSGLDYSFLLCYNIQPSEINIRGELEGEDLAGR